MQQQLVSIYAGLIFIFSLTGNGFVISPAWADTSNAMNKEVGFPPGNCGPVGDFMDCTYDYPLPVSNTGVPMKVACPSGYLAIGGGYSTTNASTSTPKFRAMASYPITDGAVSGWAVLGYNLYNKADQARVYVTCADDPTQFTTVTGTPDLSSVASCPTGLAPIGGGYDASSVNVNSSWIFSSYPDYGSNASGQPDSGSWFVLSGYAPPETALPDDNSGLLAYAVCTNYVTSNR
jgi:hypothetical protein